MLMKRRSSLASTVSVYNFSSYTFGSSCNKTSEALLNGWMTECLHLNNGGELGAWPLRVTSVLRKDGLTFGKGFEGDWTADELRGWKGIGSGWRGHEQNRPRELGMFVKPALPTLSLLKENSFVLL